MGKKRVVDHELMLRGLRTVDDTSHSHEYLFPVIKELFPAGEELSAGEVATRMVEAFNRYLPRFEGKDRQRMKIVLLNYFSHLVIACMDPGLEFLREVELYYVDHLHEAFTA